MKILFFIGSLGSGGKERQLLYLIKELIAKNIKIKLIVFNEEIFYKEIYNYPIDLVVLNKKRKKSIITPFIIYKHISSFKPQIIHVWDNDLIMISLLYILFNKVKVVNGSIRYAGMIEKVFFHAIIDKMAFFFSDRIVSNSMQGLKVEKLDNINKSRCIYNGFDMDHFLSLPKHSITKRFSVAMIGRFAEAKDYYSFIKAAKLILQDNENIDFYCIGDGPNKKQMEDFAGELKNTRIYFTGNRSDIHNILQDFNVGILLNNTNGHAEGISNAIMEYMAAGLPVIATNAGGTPEIVADNITGFLVPAFDVSAVVNKINYLYKNKELSQRMGENGRKIISEKFGINNMIDKYINLYSELC